MQQLPAGGRWELVCGACWSTALPESCHQPSDGLLLLPFEGERGGGGRTLLAPRWHDGQCHLLLLLRLSRSHPGWIGLIE